MGNVSNQTNSRTLSEEDLNFLRGKCDSIESITTNTNLIIGIKDSNSVHVGCSEGYAKIIGLSKHDELVGKTDFEIPCSGVANFANQYKLEDELVVHQDKNTSNLKTLNIHKYEDGLKARIFNKSPLINPFTQSIVGLMFTAHDALINDFLNILPNYYKLFGNLDSFKNQIIDPTIELNDYEQEICYLLVLQWDLTQITVFMNTFRPLNLPRTVDAIRKKKDYICEKLQLPNKLTATLVEHLISKGFQQSMPKQFLDRILGSKIIDITTSI